MRSIVLVVVAFLVLASAAIAQPQKYDAGVFADQNGTQTSLEAMPFTPFEVYGLAWDLDGGFKAQEGGAIFDPSILVLGAMYNPPGVICLDCEPTNWAVGSITCYETPANSWFWLITWDAMIVGPSMDLPICLTAHQPSGFVPPAPGYARCDDSIQPFGVAENGQGIYPDGCLIVNPTFEPPIGNGSESWGSVKVRY